MIIFTIIGVVIVAFIIFDWIYKHSSTTIVSTKPKWPESILNSNGVYYINHIGKNKEGIKVASTITLFIADSVDRVILVKAVKGIEGLDKERFMKLRTTFNLEEFIDSNSNSDLEAIIYQLEGNLVNFQTLDYLQHLTFTGRIKENEMILDVNIRYINYLSGEYENELIISKGHFLFNKF